MEESFEDKITRVRNRLDYYVKLLQLDFSGIEVDTDSVSDGGVILRVRVCKSKEQLVAEKLMEEPIPAGYVKPGVYVVESDVSSVVYPDGICSLIGSADHGPGPISYSVHVAVPELP